MEKKKYIYGVITGVVIMLIINMGYFGAVKVKNFLQYNNIVLSEKEYDDIEDKFQDIGQVLERRYYEDFEMEDLYESSIEGFVNGIGDPYTTYFSKDEFDSFLEGLAGSYEGIGVVVSYGENGKDIIVVAPFEDSPGEKGGMLPSDKIIKVDNIEVTGMTLEQVVDRIRGEKGTQVTITVYREESQETLDLVITRDVISMQTVSYEMLDNNIGYIQLSGFEEVTYDQFMEAYQDLEAQGQEGMIIDLRNNPGGLVTSVEAISDELLPEGLIVYTEDKAGNREELFSDAGHQFTKPLVILVNENSASASEILAGAVKDYGIGTIVGTTTFGKGLVQSSFRLDDGSALKVTIAKYFTPSGNYIHSIGIEPDVIVELPKEYENQLYIERENDTQFQKAVEVMLEKLQ